MKTLSSNQPTYLMNTISIELLNRFITFIDARSTTVATYTRALRQFFKYLINNEITTPTRRDVINYRDQLKIAGHKPATIAAYIVAIRQFFYWTETENIFPNISANVKGAKIDRNHKKDPLTSRQVKSVLSKIDRSTLIGARDYAVLTVMICGGLRTIEVIRASIEDLRSLGDDVVLFIQGKGKDEKSDYVKIPGPAENAIREYFKNERK